jgi:hypothetical protein
MDVMKKPVTEVAGFLAVSFQKCKCAVMLMWGMHC